MAGLDCVVIGYNEGDFDHYRLMCEERGPGSVEYQIYRKEHLDVDGQAVSWMDAFSRIRNQVTGGSDRYHVGEVYNLASIYLCNALRRRRLWAEPVSLFGAELDRLRDLLEQAPTVVAITTTFYVSVLPVVPVVDFVRTHAPRARIVVGGPLIENLCAEGLTDEVRDSLDVMAADIYVLDSQGEHTLGNLCLALRDGADVRQVPNVILDVEHEWVATARVPESNSLDEHWIDWTVFDAAMIGPTAQLRTARSCAFKCTFCDYPIRAGALSTTSVDVVRRELAALADLGVRNIVFVDDTFNVPPKRFTELCRMMERERFGFSWYSYFRCSTARSDEIYDAAAASGCAGVFLGIESADSGVLANMKKLAQDDQYRSGIARLKDRGITTFASIIVGFPGETEQSVDVTADFLNETEPTFWRAQPWWYNHRSPIHHQRELHDMRGAGYQWSHRTMDARQAAALCDDLFDRVTGSTWLPLYDFDFWSLPYLDGKGLGVSDLRRLLDLSHSLMSERDRAVPDAVKLAGLTASFRGAVGAVVLDPPRFQW